VVFCSIQRSSAASGTRTLRPAFSDGSSPAATIAYVIPGLGRVPLAKLTPQKLQEFINERHSTGLSAATVKHINATLRAALSQAQRWQLVHQNAAKLITLPKSVRFQPAILTPLQAKKLLAFARGHRHEALFTVAMTMGLRRGELLGLRWCNIDFEKSSLEVRHSLEKVKGKGLHLAEPKSEKAKRVLRIPQICLSALAKHRIAQSEARLWSGSKWKEFDFVFTTAIGTPINPANITRIFPRILDDAGLPRVRFHDLRHTRLFAAFAWSFSKARPRDSESLHVSTHHGYLLAYDSGTKK
jgi:integrase